MRTLLIATICLLHSVAGFSQVKFVLTSNTNYRSVNYNKVVIYLEREKVPANAEEIGLVLCEGDNLAKEMIQAKKKASDYGANGLYMYKGGDNDILTSRRASDSEKDLQVNGKRKTEYRATMTFVAVRVPEQPDTSAHQKVVKAIE